MERWTCQKYLSHCLLCWITYIFPTQVQNCQVLVNHSNYLIIRSLHVHVTSIIRHLRQFLFLNAGKYLMFVKFYLVGFLPAQTLIWDWSLLNKAPVLTVERVLREKLFGTVPVLWSLEGQGKNNTLDLGSWSIVPILLAVWWYLACILCRPKGHCHSTSLFLWKYHTRPG